MKKNIDKNKKHRKDLATMIFNGYVVNSFGKELKLHSVDKLSKAPMGFDYKCIYRARILDGTILIPGHGETELDSIIDCFRHMESMGYTFQSYDNDVEETAKSEKKTDSKNKNKQPALESRRMKQLPFL